MSGLVSTTGLWGADKAVTLSGYTPHKHDPSPIKPHFVAPERVSSLTFGPLALAAAVARAATTRDDAPVTVLNALHRSTLPMLETMIEDGTTFSLSPNFQYLADTEHTFLAARVGSGIADLYIWGTLGGPTPLVSLRRSIHKPTSFTRVAAQAAMASFSPKRTDRLLLRSAPPGMRLLSLPLTRLRRGARAGRRRRRRRGG